MPQAKPRYPTIEDYLDSDEVIEGRFEYKDGELIPVVPENFLNDTIAVALLFYLVNKGFFPLSLVKAHSCEIQFFRCDVKPKKIPWI